MRVDPGKFSRNRNISLAILLLLTSCGGGESPGVAAGDAAKLLTSHATTSGQRSAAVAGPVQNPILFVAQVPTFGDFSRLATFANHIPRADAVVRGGDLMIRYADGTLRNLTGEAGFGMADPGGLQTVNAIAVREPSVHWSGTKAIFSMLVGGAPKQFEHPQTVWQLYEVTGLGKGQTVSIAKVPNQPVQYNNVSPLYASDDRILFTSDRPRSGEHHLYPQLDEYESTPTIVGLYSLNPANGQLALLNHTPSGAFTPIIDSFGRIIFTRWDHLQRDQMVGSFQPRNYASEADGPKLPQQPETFPEPREASTSPYGPVTRYFANVFSPWQMNQDGTGELTLNHIGRQEFAVGGFMGKSFNTDTALEENVNPALFSNRKTISDDAGIFQIREDPQQPGIYYGIYTHEFGTLTTDQIVRMTGAPSLNAEQMTIVDATPISSQGGRFRNPLPMSSGQMVATYTPSPTVVEGMTMRLHQLETSPSGMLVPGVALTQGINKTLSWFSPDVKLSYSGPLWEVEPVEVVARARPNSPISTVEPTEKMVLDEEQVDEQQLRNWLKSNNLALIVTRNQTSRDRGDRQQPFNLRVPGGVKTIGTNGLVYDIAHYQIFQANQVRGYDNFTAGRRVIAQPISGAHNVGNPGGPVGSVRIASDGSTAAFVPANRALTWQTTDGSGTPIVRERMWVTMQPGEIRTCAGCHGENTRNQAGLPASLTKPQALRDLLRQWKQNAPIRVNGSQPRVPPAHP